MTICWSWFGIFFPNPIRAGLVADMKSLEGFPYCGHSRLMGKIESGFQDTEKVLSMFGRTRRGGLEAFRGFCDERAAGGKKAGVDRRRLDPERRRLACSKGIAPGGTFGRPVKSLA
jgi:hypothetical protein